MSHMESVRLSINEHMTSVGEEILLVLEKQRGDDFGGVKLNVRVFVLERLHAAAQFMYDFLRREMEPLETLLETQNKLLDIYFLDPNTAGWLKQSKVLCLPRVSGLSIQYLFTARPCVFHSRGSMPCSRALH